MIKKVSILLCAYNAEAFIAEAIESTLAQTFYDYEFIIINDGSTDNTLNIIKSFSDERIKVSSKEHNYIASLNWGLKLCQGEYIARMDADDIMEPSRLDKQVELMDSNPGIAVCCSLAQAFGKVNNIMGGMVREEVHNSHLLFLLGNFIIHPTSMIRRKFLTDHRLYYKDYPYAEDFKLWTDIARYGGRFFVIPQILLRYRHTDIQVSHVHNQEQNESRLLIQQEIIEKEFQKIPSIYRQRTKRLFNQMILCHKDGLLTADTIIRVMFQTFNNIYQMSNL